MAHITLIVPFVSVNQECIDVTQACLKSFKNKVDKIILIKNGGAFPVPQELSHLANIYIDLAFNICMAGAINSAYLSAKESGNAEFLLFSNNDIRDDNCDLQELCAEGFMRSPNIGSQGAAWGAHASFFCIHIKDFEKVGFWNVWRGNAADEDWFKRASRVVQLQNINHLYVLHDHPAFTNGLIESIESI